MSTYPDDNRGSGNIPPTRVVAVANHDLRALMYGGLRALEVSIRGEGPSKGRRSRFGEMFF